MEEEVIQLTKHFLLSIVFLTTLVFTIKEVILIISDKIWKKIIPLVNVVRSNDIEYKPIYEPLNLQETYLGLIYERLRRVVVKTIKLFKK